MSEKTTKAVAEKKNPIVTREQLLEAGAHFGRQKRRWNPKMKPYIYGERNNAYIIDLSKTMSCTEDAYAKIKKIAAKKGTFLFVSTRKHAAKLIKDNAKRTDSSFVTERWYGGTLTNFKTISLRIRRLWEIEKMEKSGDITKYPKKEQIQMIKEKEKLEKFLGGIKRMKQVPDALIVVNPKQENNAILEAKKLGIPVFGIVNTSDNPESVSNPIPANDNAPKTLSLILGVLGNAIMEGRGKKGLPTAKFLEGFAKPEKKVFTKKPYEGKKEYTKAPKKEATKEEAN